MAINLSGLRTPEQIAVGHVLDTLVAVTALQRLLGAHGAQPGSASVIDLGSGGGFPGIPLALALPAARAQLVDSIGKKARFLDVVGRAVAAAARAADGVPPDLSALADRAEDLADEPDQREAHDLIVARAVGSVGEVAELALPLLRRGGYVAVWKQSRGDGALETEVEQARHIAVAAGGTPPRIEVLPGAERVGLAGHCLVTIRKARVTPARYPRAASERRRALLP